MRILLSIIILAGSSCLTIGQNAEFSGFTRGSVFGGGEIYDYTSIFGEMGLQTRFGEGNTFLFSDLRFRSGLDFGEQSTNFQIKEAYAAYRGEKFDISLGKQIVQWGRMDGFNPTNNISSYDYFFLSGDPDDQKISSFMLRMRYRLNQAIDIDLIGIPFYVPSVYRYDLFDFGDAASFGKAAMPDKTFENGSIGARVNFEYPGIGFSVSYFNGYDPFYGFAVSVIDWSTGTPLITNNAKPYHKQTFGADFSIPVSSWIIRGEVAWNINEESKGILNVPNSNLAYVAGIETSFAGVTTIVQYIGKYDLEFTELQSPVITDPNDLMAMMLYVNALVFYESESYNRHIFNQTEELNHGVALMLSRSFAFDLLNVELAGYYNITTEEYLIRPKISYKMSDGLTLSTGVNFMDGPENTVFDYSGKVLNGGFLELKATF
ncbi:MAG: hypothetical protein KAH17_09930 [Bacteroidales bacterium]|nr:hypothetical protein [Bacteroidales bacterium]